MDKGRMLGSIPSDCRRWVAANLRKHLWTKDVFNGLNDFEESLSPEEQAPQPKTPGLIGAFPKHENNSDECSRGEILHQLERAGIQADTSTYAALLRWCGNAKALRDGKRLHRHILKRGLDRNILLSNLLVQMYGNCGALEIAHALFAQLHDRNEYSWNFMIAAYARHGQGNEAFQLFAQMEEECIMPNKFIFASILIACASREVLLKAKRIHTRIVTNGLETDITVGTCLINMYSKCGSLDDACRIFAKIPEHNTVSWTAIVTAHAHHGQAKHALQLFEQMQQEGAMPSKVTLAGTLSACTSEAFLTIGKQLHACVMDNEFGFGIIFETALLMMYAKCACLEEARHLFDNICKRDELCWNAMIAGCAQHGRCKDALSLFDQMLFEGVLPNKFIFASIISACASQAALAEGKQVHACIMGSEFESDVVVGNALVNMYGKCGSLEVAQRMFDNMHERDKYLWTAMIVAYAQHGKGKDAIRLFERMQREQVKPDKVTFASILSACAGQATLAEGKLMHSFIEGSRLELDLIVGNALVNMYAKCGSLKDARNAFDKMAERDSVSWNAMIAAHAQHGQSKHALQLFKLMQHGGVSPNDVTFVSVLSACSHTGMVDEGWQYFKSMIQDYGISPHVDHYNCMLDLLARAGRLDEVEDLLMNMPLKPTAVSWMTLLGACRSLVDVGRGEFAAEKLFELDPKSTAPYVMLANMYVIVGMEDEAAEVLKAMNEKGLKQQPGCTSIEIKGRVYDFFAYSQLHPRKEEIYVELQRLTRQMDEGRLVCDQCDVGFEPYFLEEYKCCSHSEMIATAFGLISTIPGTPLFLSKSSFMCPECHSAIKNFSKITCREIVIRDDNCFHRMNDGICSCAENW